uniref:Uncharacterized protein n=1 Tax=Lepeophtheirus salmonis TaxID=72036 RepID=A0A0K2TJ51_LEPSM
MIYNHLIDKLIILFVFCVVTLNNTAADSQNYKSLHLNKGRPSSSRSQQPQLSSIFKYNNLLKPVLKEALHDIYFTKLSAKNSVLENAQFKSKRYVHHVNPLFKNYNYLRKTECPPLPDGTRQYFCPTPDIHGRWSCIKSDDLCDTVPQCPGSEDEDKKLCLFHLPVLDKLDAVGTKIGELASMISINIEGGQVGSSRKPNNYFNPSLFNEVKNVDVPDEVFEIMNERSSTTQRRRKGHVASSPIRSEASSTSKEPSIEEFAKMMGLMDLNNQIQASSSNY